MLSPGLTKTSNPPVFTAAGTRVVDVVEGEAQVTVVGVGGIEVDEAAEVAVGRSMEVPSDGGTNATNPATTIRPTDRVTPARSHRDTRAPFRFLMTVLASMLPLHPH
jgi:hypothetical protein